MRFDMGKQYAFVIGGSLLSAIAIAVMVFAIGPSSDTTEAATDGAAMSLRVDASQTVPCPGGPIAGEVCVVMGQTFDVIVVADAIPMTNGYILAQVWVDYDSNGLVHKNNTQALWPDCNNDTFLAKQDEVNHGASASCLTSLLPPQPASFHKGDLYSFKLTCTDQPSLSSIEILRAGDPVAGTAGARMTEAQDFTGITPQVSGIAVNCVPPPPPAMSLRVDASQTTDCPGGPVAGKVCVGLSQTFDVIVVADAVPMTNGYIFAQAWIDYDDQGLVHKKNTVALWPDCAPSTFLSSQNETANGASANCFTSLLSPQPASFHKGDLYSFSLTCTAGASASAIRILVLEAPAGTSGAVFYEFGTNANINPTVSGIMVNCVPPPPVGGVSLDDGLRGVASGAVLEPESSSSRAGWLVAGLAALAAALAAAGAFALAHTSRRR